MNVGFIGLGLMGNPMAKNILKRGFPLWVYNRTLEKTKELADLGATVTKSPTELAEHTDVIITMVTAAQDVKDILMGTDGIVSGAKPGLILIDMSTIGPTSAKDIAQELEEKNIDFLDAPVTGSTPKAITGELTIFVGGKPEVLEKAHAVLAAMGTNIIHLGPSGSGQAIKLINNYLIASTVSVLSESLILADSMGLPREKVSEALLKTPNLSGTAQMKLPNLVTETFPLLFSLSNMRKDLGLARKEMEQNTLHLPNLEHVESVYGMATEDQTLAAQDFTVVIQEIKKESFTDTSSK